MHRLTGCWVLRSQVVTAVAIVAELAVIMPRVLTELWLWPGLTIALVLSYLAIYARLRRLGPAANGRAFRHAVVGAPVITIALTMPIALALGLGKFSVDGLLATTLGSAVLAVPPAAVGYAAIERSLPAGLREPDSRRWVWRPSSRQLLALLLAWPVFTGALFWVITGVTTDTGCVEDGSCSFGVPLEFAHFGRRGAEPRMMWDRFMQDLGLFASLLPAGFLCATSRTRWVFAVYLLLIGAWLTIASVLQWSGLFGLRMWARANPFEW